MQHAGIDVAEHAVTQPLAVEERPEFRDEIGEPFRRDGRILHEGDRAGIALGGAEEAHRLLAHGPEPLDGVAPGDGEAEALRVGAALGLQQAGEPRQGGLHGGRVVADEFHEIDAVHRPSGRIVGKEGPHLGPDRILAGERQHRGVDGLHRGGTERQQRLRVAERRIEIDVGQRDQHCGLRDRQHVEPRLGDQRQRSFGAADHALEVEPAARVAQMGEVVAGEAAVELGKALRDERRIRGDDGIDGAVDRPDPVVAPLGGFEPFRVEGLGGPDRAVGEHAGQRQDVIPGLAVEARALPAGIGGDHAADRGAVRGGEFRREEQAVLGELPVELVLHHSRLDPDEAVRDVDLQDAVHMPRGVDHEAVAQRLAVGTGRPAPGPDHDLGKARILEELGDAHEIVAAAGKGHGPRRHLVDRVVGGEDRAVGVRQRQIALEAAQAQLGAGGNIERHGLGVAGQDRDHPRLLHPAERGRPSATG